MSIYNQHTTILFSICSLITRGTTSNSSSNNSQPLTPEELSQNKNFTRELENNGWHNPLSFVSACNENNIKIIDVTNHHITLETTDGTQIITDIGFYRYLTNHENIDVTFDEIFHSINEVPPVFRENKPTISFVNDTNDRCFYQDGQIHIHASVLNHTRDDTQFITGVIAHEFTHNLDLQGMKLTHGNADHVLNEVAYSANPQFRDLIKKGDTSWYSYTYRTDPVGRYYTESLAEIMKITAKAKIYGTNSPEAMIHGVKTEQGLTYGEDMSYTEWSSTHPELARLGEDLWNAKTREDIVQAFNSIY